MRAKKRRNRKTRNGSLDVRLDFLADYVERLPAVLIRLDEETSSLLQDSQNGLSEFTWAQPHEAVRNIRTPTVCLIYSDKIARSFGEKDVRQLHLGILSNIAPVTTLQSRLKIRVALAVHPGSEKELVNLIDPGVHRTRLSKIMLANAPVTLLAPKLSRNIVANLARVPTNRKSLGQVAQNLQTPADNGITFALQEDAIQICIKAFGLSGKNRAASLELSDSKASALSRVQLSLDPWTNSPEPANREPTSLPRAPLIEDAAIELDARVVPGFSLASADITGRAVFKNAEDELEVITANRRDLEHVLGVDLIYLNLPKKCVVMVQYKMLERAGRGEESADWVYRPDKNMAKELLRMRRFSRSHTPDRFEYRLNSEVFYFKFVKRDANLGSAHVITPADHYRRIIKDPSCRGIRKGVRISYQSLSGRYLRQAAFIDLIRSGYIGAFSETTKDLSNLVAAVLGGERALVVAIQKRLSPTRRGKN
jgi:hypothetical protein